MRTEVEAATHTTEGTALIRCIQTDPTLGSVVFVIRLWQHGTRRKRDYATFSQNCFPPNFPSKLTSSKMFSRINFPSISIAFYSYADEIYKNRRASASSHVALSCVCGIIHFVAARKQKDGPMANWTGSSKLGSGRSGGNRFLQVNLFVKLTDD